MNTFLSSAPTRYLLSKAAARGLLQLFSSFPLDREEVRVCVCASAGGYFGFPGVKQASSE